MHTALVLCDFAEIDLSGKAPILGAGWSVTGPEPGQHGIVAFIKVPPGRLGTPVPVTLRLLGPEQEVVEVPGVGGVQRLEISGQVEVREPEVWDGQSDLTAMFTVNIGPLPLRPGTAYTWIVEVDGKETAETRFFVRPLRPAS